MAYELSNGHTIEEGNEYRVTSDGTIFNDGSVLRVDDVEYYVADEGHDRCNVQVSTDSRKKKLDASWFASALHGDISPV